MYILKTITSAHVPSQLYNIFGFQCYQPPINRNPVLFPPNLSLLVTLDLDADHPSIISWVCLWIIYFRRKIKVKII